MNTVKNVLVNLFYFFTYGICFCSFLILLIGGFYRFNIMPLWLNIYTICALGIYVFFIIASILSKQNSKLSSANLLNKTVVVTTVNLIMLTLYNPGLALYVFKCFISLITGAYFNQ